MSGPNGDPDISIDDGIIEDGDEFGDEGRSKYVHSFCIMQIIVE